MRVSPEPVCLTPSFINSTIKKIPCLSFLVGISFVCSLLLILPAKASKPEIVLQTNHLEFIKELEFSPDSKLIASGSPGDDQVKIWDVATGKQIRSLKGHSDGIQGLYFTANSKSISSVDGTNTVRAWNLENGTELFQKKIGSSTAYAKCSMSPDLKLMAINTQNHSTDVQNSDDAKKYCTENDVDQLVFSADSKKCAFSKKGHIKIQDVHSGTSVSLQTGFRYSRAVSLSLDGKLLAVVGDESTIKIFDAFTGNELGTLKENVKPAFSIASIAFSPDGKSLASTYDKKVKLWNLATYREQQIFTGHSDSVLKVVFSANGMLASTGFDKCIKLWDVSNGKELCSMRGASIDVTGVTFSPDGRRLVMGLGNGCIKVWDFSRTKFSSLENDLGPVSIAFTTDGNTLACHCHNYSLVNLWDLNSEKIIGKIDHFDSNGPISFSADGANLITTTSSGGVKVWDTKTFEEVSGFSHAGSAQQAVVHPKEPIVVSSSESLIFLNHINGRTIPRDMEGGGGPLAFSGDGKRLASGGDFDKGDVIIWDFNNSKKERVLPGHASSRLNCLLFSPDGQILVSGGDDNLIRIWDVSSGSLKAVLKGHHGGVSSLSFSADGKLLMSLARDNTAKLWNMSAFSEVLSLTFGQQEWVAVSPEGFFDASNLDEIESLAWSIPDEPIRAYPVEIFLQKFFEPNLIYRACMGETFSKSGPSIEINRAQPIVTVEMVEPHKDCPDIVDVTVSYQNTFSTQPSRKGEASGVYDLKLFRDGSLVGYLPNDQSFDSQQRVDLVTDMNKRETSVFTVNLPRNGAASHTFSAFAFNIDHVKSQTSKFIYNRKPSSPVKGNAYVIAFGVDQYDDPGWNLSCAVADAQEYELSLVPCMRKQNLFSTVFPIKLVSPNSENEIPATKESLKEVLLALSGKRSTHPQISKIQKVKPEDFVLLSFSCHGAASAKTGEFYLFPSNIGRGQNLGLTPSLEKAGISSAELTDWVRDIDASKIVLIIDACHSGAFEEKGFKPGPIGSRGLGQLAYYKKMTMLAASQAEGKARENSILNHGLLTFALLKKGLSSDGFADSTPYDKRISMNELLHFACEEVPRLDEGNFKARSVGEALSDLRDLTIEGEEYRSGALQLPVFRDFSRSDSDFCLLDLNSKTAK